MKELCGVTAGRGILAPAKSLLQPPKWSGPFAPGRSTPGCRGAKDAWAGKQAVRILRSAAPSQPWRDLDRLGRDALDVQATVRKLLDKGVAVEVQGLGRIARGVGELILAVLAQVADMERQRIRERTQAGREKARQALATTGRTHRGKASLGRPKAHDPQAVAQHGASITATAQHFGCSDATVKRACRSVVS